MKSWPNSNLSRECQQWQVLILKGRYNEVIGLIGRALEKQPRLAYSKDVRIILALSFILGGRPALSIPLLKAEIKDSPFKGRGEDNEEREEKNLEEIDNNPSLPYTLTNKRSDKFLSPSYQNQLRTWLGVAYIQAGYRHKGLRFMLSHLRKSINNLGDIVPSNHAGTRAESASLTFHYLETLPKDLKNNVLLQISHLSLLEGLYREAREALEATWALSLSTHQKIYRLYLLQIESSLQGKTDLHDIKTLHLSLKKLKNLNKESIPKETTLASSLQELSPMESEREASFLAHLFQIQRAVNSHRMGLRDAENHIVHLKQFSHMASLRYCALQTLRKLALRQGKYFQATSYLEEAERLYKEENLPFMRTFQERLSEVVFFMLTKEPRLQKENRLVYHKHFSKWIPRSLQKKLLKEEFFALYLKEGLITSLISFLKKGLITDPHQIYQLITICLDNGQFKIANILTHYARKHNLSIVDDPIKVRLALHDGRDEEAIMLLTGKKDTASVRLLTSLYEKKHAWEKALQAQKALFTSNDENDDDIAMRCLFFMRAGLIANARSFYKAWHHRIRNKEIKRYLNLILEKKEESDAKHTPDIIKKTDQFLQDIQKLESLKL